ncbi:hypothetical protein FGIG_04372 [Fasciola gigantica]|uniref:Uncharacterized protein n=1 Tax=Fasciola gigantica TaxID=46835 RepID=A0A504Y822_FASGI|nr:hypothetical protein FGIG_04372 [Fasciola gigantica]
MSLAPGFCGPIHVCRRLFCEPTQNLVHQTLEAVMRKDQERFSKLWNFPPSDVTGRQPLVSRNVVTSDSEPNSAPKNEPTVSSWRLFQPEAGFYVTPPRKLKAYRRLNQSVAQKTRLEMLCIPKPNAPSSASTNSEIPLEEKCDQIKGNPTPVRCRSPSVQVQTVTAPGRPLTPILIRPSPEEEPPRLPYLEQLNLQDGLKGPIRSGHKITLVRSRHSEQIKRRSGAKVTDYFTVSKRPRQSLK